MVRVHIAEARMPDASEEDKWAALVQQITPGGQARQIRDLPGGTSARVTVLEIEQADGQSRVVVARRHGVWDLQRNPRIAADEWRLLHRLHSAGIPVPAPVFLEQTSAIFGSPVIVVDYVEGVSEWEHASVPGLVQELATLLARIHALEPIRADLAFLPRQADLVAARLSNLTGRLDEALQEGIIRETLERVWPLPRGNPTSLLHGDYWPGNVLWREGRIAAVLDWEDAALGDPLADLGNTRLEVLWAFGVDAMHIFTRHYQSVASIDCGNLPYWDLCAALRPANRLSHWGLEPDVERSMREAHRWFVGQAFGQLAG
jgi:aminoglycoside phosphotransferase (APT) family kinase protein